MRKLDSQGKLHVTSNDFRRAVRLRLSRVAALLQRVRSTEA